MLFRKGLDSHILRFEARMVSKVPENCSRIFIISYYLADDTVAVFEVGRRNSGTIFNFIAAIFVKKNKYKGDEAHIFGSKVHCSGFDYIYIFRITV